MDQTLPAVGALVEPPVRPCAWAHRYSPRGLLHTLRDNQQDAEDDAAIVGGSAHAVALYDERALDAAVSAERERCAQIVEYYNPGGSYHIRTALAFEIRRAERIV